MTVNKYFYLTFLEPILTIYLTSDRRKKCLCRFCLYVFTTVNAQIYQQVMPRFELITFLAITNLCLL